jgi:hypothetical protein
MEKNRMSITVTLSTESETLRHKASKYAELNGIPKQQAQDGTISYSFEDYKRAEAFASALKRMPQKVLRKQQPVAAKIAISRAAPQP